MNATVASLPEKWREENGDYPESKQDCANELKAALATPEQPEGKWICGFCRQTYTLEAICCHAQRQFRADALAGKESV
jgi:hypothetical protein